MKALFQKTKKESSGISKNLKLFYCNYFLAGVKSQHMRQPFKFFVAGVPMAQPRAKASHFGGFTRVYTPKGSHENWGMCVRAEAQKHFGGAKWEGPLCVNLTFYFPRPKAHFNSKGLLKPNAPKWHTQKPDRDNADKKIMDTLTNLGIWGDDKQVCDGRIRKFYTNFDGTAGCEIEIKEATNE